MDVPSLCSCSPCQPGWGGPARSSQGAGGTRPLSHPEQAAGLGGLGCCGQASLRDVQEGMRKWQDWRGLQGLKITRGDAVRPPGPAGAVLTSCPSPETPSRAWGSARLLGRCCLLPGGGGQKGLCDTPLGSAGVGHVPGPTRVRNQRPPCQGSSSVGPCGTYCPRGRGATGSPGVQIARRGREPGRLCSRVHPAPLSPPDFW